MLVRTLVVLACVGCTDPELERSTDLANVEVASLEMYVGSFTMWGDLRLVRERNDPCAVLGSDFHARVGKLEISAFAGAREVNCDPSYESCDDAPLGRCASPFISLSWPPPIPTAELVIADRSRTITCALGDAFAARTMTRVDGASWDVARNERITVRVSPASDLSRFAIEVYFIEWLQDPITVPHTIDGDMLSFAIPAGLGSGTPRQTLYVHIDGDEAPDCDVPARALHSYVIEQPITVQ